MSLEETLYKSLISSGRYTEEEIEAFKMSEDKFFFLDLLDTPFKGDLKSIHIVSRSTILSEKEKEAILKRFLRQSQKLEEGVI